MEKILQCELGRRTLVDFLSEVTTAIYTKTAAKHELFMEVWKN
jgi:hypothetical protein